MKKIERFILRDILSDGPAGTVYKSDEILPGDNRRTVALKVLPQMEETLTGETAAEERFFGEVRVLAQLAVHPNVVTIYSMGLTEGYPWLAMEFAPKTLLTTLTENAEAAGADEIVRLLEQVGRGLSAMHALKPPLIHQDIKPANLLIDALGNYKITDFSLATVTAAHKTHGLATVRYAAPEMLSSEFGRVGPAADLYALGHIAYEMALGAKLHRAQFPAVYEGNSGKEPAPNKWMMWHASIGMKPADAAGLLPDFPGTLSEIIARLMAKALAERYASADELLSDLRVLRQEMEGAPALRGMPASAAAPPMPVAVGSRPAAAKRGDDSIPFAASESPAKAPGSSYQASPTPAAGDGKYWVRLRGKVSGPYDLPTLRALVKKGQVSRLHQVSADQATWKQAAEIDGLYNPAVV